MKWETETKKIQDWKARVMGDLRMNLDSLTTYYQSHEETGMDGSGMKMDMDRIKWNGNGMSI